MSTSARLTLLAALAVALASSALLPVYEDLGWLLAVLGAVGAVALAGLVGRRLKLPALLQPLLAVLAVGAYVVALYARQTLTLGVVPTRETAAVLGTRIGEGLLDVEQLAPAVPTSTGLVLLAVLGIAAVAAVVDLLAAGLRHPAVAGLPLLLLLAVPSAVLEGGVGWLPFALGASGWLALLLADGSDRIGQWGAPLRSATASRPRLPQDSGTGRVGRRIGMAALGVAVLVPALVPGLDSRLLGGDGGFGSGLGGSRTTTTYNPITELGGQLRLPEPRPLLAYVTTDPAPDYLRLTTLDRFDADAGWSSSELSADAERDAVSEGIPAPNGASTASVQELETAVRIAGLGGPWLPVPYGPTSIEVAGTWLWDRRSDTVFSTRTDVGRLDEVYRVTAERVLPDATQLRIDGELPADIADTYAVVPEVSPYVAELTRDIVEGATTRYDQASALQQFFRDGSQGFRYSEDASVPGIDGPNALETFLKGKQGFCEQYASAMAGMARVLGIPARVAVGFLPGTRRPDDGTFEVTTDDAHAWPEIWFAGSGWVRFEPTPRGAQTAAPGYSVPPPPSESVPAAGTPALPSGQPQDPGAQDDVANARGLDGRQDRTAGEFAPGSESTDTPASTVAVRVLSVLTVLALLAAPAVLAAVRRRRRWANPGPLSAWEQVQEDATDVGHRWRVAESPRTAATRLQAERALPGGAPDALHRLARAVEQTRYARPATSSGAEVDSLRRDVVVVRQGLLATAPDRRRWAARFAPPSTLRWAAEAAGGALADGLDRLDDASAAVARRLRRGPRQA